MKRNFTFAIRASSAHRDHLLVEVDADTGEVRWGEPLSGDQLVAVSSQDWPARLPAAGVSQLICILLSQVAELRQRVAELEARK